MGERHVQTIDK